jgi:hypothetical protein
MSTHFPNATIFGFISKTPSGDQALDAILASVSDRNLITMSEDKEAIAKMCGRIGKAYKRLAPGAAEGAAIQRGGLIWLARQGGASVSPIEQSIEGMLRNTELVFRF